jgi:hypothetical protein
MKQIYGLIILATMLFASGCKQDETVIPAYLKNAKLLGKWNLISLEVTTAVDTDPPITADPITSFTDKDYFIFKDTNNEATFSSTMYARTFEGYYSTNNNANPKTLKFKSGDLLLDYVLESVDDQLLVVSETTRSVYAGSTTTTYKRYTYSR